MSARALAAGLALLAVASTAFEGGGSPDGILLVHGLLTALIGLALLLPPQGRGALAPVPAAALASFAAAVAVSAWHAPYGFAALLVVQDVAVGIAVLLLAARAPEEASASAVRGALLLAAALQGAVAVAQAFSGQPRPAGSFLNPNHLTAWVAAVLLASLPPLIAQGGRGRVVAVVLAVPAMGAIAAGRSRGGAAGAIAGLAVLLVLRWPTLSRTARRVAVGGALVAALLAAGVVASRLREDDPYRWTRTRIWSAALSVAGGAPWLGCGPGQFSAAAAGVRFQDPVGPLRWERSFSTPHSDLLRLPAEFGIPAALAALVFLAAGLPVAVRRARAGNGLAQASALAGLAALAVQGTVDDLTTRPALVVLGALLLGPLWAGRGAVGERFPAAARLALLACLAVAFVAGDLAPWLSWRTLAGVPRAAVPAADLARALARNPAHPDMHLRMAERLVREGLHTPEAYARARGEAEAAVRLSPGEARYRAGLARVEAAACRSLFPDEGTRARAAAHYAAALACAPRDASLLLEEATFLLSAQDAAAGERAARAALTLEPEAVRPRLVLARAILARGGPPAAAAALVDEAEARAARYGAIPKDSPYARLMLTADPREVRALRQALP